MYKNAVKNDRKVFANPNLLTCEWECWRGKFKITNKSFLKLNSCPNGEKIIMQMVQIGPKRVSRTFAQENQNEIDNFWLLPLNAL